MIRAVKKLKKYWPRKKKRKRSLTYDPFHYYHPPPSQCRSCCCSSVAAPSAPQPSAPPLPPWFDQYHEQGPIYENAAVPFVEAEFQGQNQFPTLHTVTETNDICDVTLPNGTATSTTNALLSYQQYMVAEPVYGVPVAKTPQTERSGGFLGCIVGFGLGLFRCFCPCFHIKEVN